MQVGKVYKFSIKNLVKLHKFRKSPCFKRKQGGQKTAHAYLSVISGSNSNTVVFKYTVISPE